MTAGRAAGRAGLQVAAAGRPPKGQFSEWLWRWLCRIHAAGEVGLPACVVSESAERALGQTRQVLAAAGPDHEAPGLYFDLWRGRMEQSLGGWGGDQGCAGADRFRLVWGAASRGHRNRSQDLHRRASPILARLGRA